MAIDLQHEEVLTLAEAAKALPSLRQGRKVHIATLYRWINNGVVGVRLEALRIGRTMVTSREALQRFAERLTAPASPAAPRLSDRAEAAEREAERRGL